MKDLLPKIGLSLIAVIAPIKAVMITVGVLIIIDLIMGIWAAKKRGETISSAALRRTVSKFLVYQLCILSAFLVQHFLIEDIIPMVNLVAGVIGMVEIKSVLENANTVLGYDIFKELLKKLGSMNDAKSKDEEKKD
jgi:sugar phosphate permease